MCLCKSKPVYQYDLKGNLIESYKSVSQASLALRTGHGYISDAASGKRKMVKGFVFSYKKR